MFWDGMLSHYEYVKARIIAINSNRVVRGYMMAQDWPPKNIQDSAFYLLSHGEQPVGRQMFSPTVPVVSHLLTWMWVIKGADISAGQVGPNRGLRFQVSYQMKDEIKQALYPYFCQKFTWGWDNSVPPNFVGTAASPIQYVGWQPPSYQDKLDKQSGVVYGSAAIRVWDMLDQITA